MEQHPIPQQISAYQFRLVGDMTLRQFSQLAGGLLVALFCYILPIPSFIKWFLVFFFGFLGFALAFLPLEDRPLDQWLGAFIKSIYTSTMFIWKKGNRLPAFLEDAPPIAQSLKKAALATPDPRTSRLGLKKYLETFSTPTGEDSPADKKEKEALAIISDLFSSTRLPPTITPQPQKTKLSDQLMPQLKIKPRKLTAPPSESVMVKMGLPPTEEIDQPLPPDRKKKRRGSDKLPTIKISPQRQRKGKVRVQAKTSSDLPIPTAPTQPNIIVGMVLNNEGKIVESAIIEIRDKESLPVRALRTNRLGQFQIVTPLPNGIYEIEVEKEELVFDIIKLNLTGEIVPPIEIRAR